MREPLFDIWIQHGAHQIKKIKKRRHARPKLSSSDVTNLKKESRLIKLKTSQIKSKWESPTDVQPLKLVDSDAMSPVEEVKNYPGEQPKSQLERITFNDYRSFLKKNEASKSELNFVVVDVDPWVWKSNKDNCVPLIPFRGQEMDDHLLYLTKYIRWVFKIGKCNSKSSESGSICSLNLYRHRSVWLRKSNNSDIMESFADAEIPDKLLLDFHELYHQ